MVAGMVRPIPALFFLVVGVFCFEVVRAEIYYVSPAGSDAGAGSVREPFGTFGRAREKASAGDTVFFRGGVYSIQETEITELSGVVARVFGLGKSGTELSPIRYWAYPGEQPVFDFSAVNPAGYRVYAFHITGDWLHFRGLTVTGCR
ncbi:hypothetical protein Hsar01_03872 [Haloferula sargassicola]|uniref:Pel9A-like right handed beta-helix region domain-containing protein n=1 Tax=Haloferula sargassicola TaxID=490096 RepID=A0ABP9UV89_9BACT